MMTILQNQEETWMLLLLKKCQETVDYIDISEEGGKYQINLIFALFI